MEVTKSHLDIARELRLDFDKSFLTYMKLFVSKNQITIAQDSVKASK